MDIPYLYQRYLAMYLILEMNEYEMYNIFVYHAINMLRLKTLLGVKLHHSENTYSIKYSFQKK